MQNIACNEDCLLRSILDETVKKIQLYNEIENDLSDLLNKEPAKIVEIATKMETTNALLKEKLNNICSTVCRTAARSSSQTKE